MPQVVEMKENKMGVMKVPQLLISMSLPMIISMLVQACYNIVDSIFVGRIDVDALTAVSLAFPVQNLMIAVASGTGVGINALLSRSLGEKKHKAANLAAINGIFVTALSYLVFAIFGIFAVRVFYTSQTSEAQIIAYGEDYLRICCIMSLGVFMQIVFERLLQSTGKTFYNMITQGTGAIINIILDPILIFGLLGFPELGVKGAALATVIGQISGMLLAIYFNLRVNHDIKISFNGFKPHKETILGIYSVGLPSIIMMAISSVMTFGLNKILMMFTPVAAAVFGVYFKLQSFVFMPVFGLNNGMVPIVAYNYGAKNKARILETIKLSIIIAVVFMMIGLAVFQLMPRPLLELFSDSEELITIGIPALRTISLSFLFAGFCIIILSVFQALGNGVLSLIVSASRQLVVILPVAYLFAKVFGLDAVWYAFPIAEIVSVTLSLVGFRYIYNKLIKPLS